MERLKKLFHILSYIQYPMMLIGLFFVVKPLFFGVGNLLSNEEDLFSAINYGLIFFGVALSFSTLQDSNKLSLKLENKIYSNPLKGKLAIILTLILVFIFFVYGFIGFFGISEKAKYITEFSYGSIILGIGLIGYLKLQVEIFENHRKDKQI